MTGMRQLRVGSRHPPPMKRPRRGIAGGAAMGAPARWTGGGGAVPW
jgi:hypothetical protein